MLIGIYRDEETNKIVGRVVPSDYYYRETTKRDQQIAHLSDNLQVLIDAAELFDLSFETLVEKLKIA